MWLATPTFRKPSWLCAAPNVGLPQPGFEQTAPARLASWSIVRALKSSLTESFSKNERLSALLDSAMELRSHDFHSVGPLALTGQFRMERSKDMSLRQTSASLHTMRGIVTCLSLWT
jgi:hypothetical protein